jgi:lantibiotic modifying enzyme
MSVEECEKQESFIRKSFYAKRAGFHSQEQKDKALNLSLLEQQHTEEEIFKTVNEIAHELLKNAFRSSDGSLGWISLEPNPQFGKFELQPISDSLYSGKTGIALFFSALYCLTKEERWKQEALSALKSVRRQIEIGNGKRLTNALGIGGMSGVGSVIYGLTKISMLLDEPSLLKDAKARPLCDRRHLENDKMHDIIGGERVLFLRFSHFGR